jgi:uncharacterized oxidoreductase
MKTKGSTILITGGSSGIGRELARQFQLLGNDVIVAGRRREQLDETIGDRERMTAFVLDVADAGSIASGAQEVATNHPALNVLIHCAGIMRYEKLTAESSTKDIEETIATNFSGTVLLTHALLPHLLATPDAAIVTVSSGLAFVPHPAAPTYNATKAAIHAYSIALREQLRDRVEVVELIPPAVQTDLTPGQSANSNFLPLSDFIDETMALFQQTPTPEEVLVNRVLFQRNAEREGRFDKALAMLTGR